METPNIIHSNTWTPSVVVSSDSSLAAKASIIETRTEDFLTTVAPPPTTMTRSDRIASWQGLSSRVGCSGRIRAQPSVSAEAIIAPDILLQEPRIGVTNVPPNTAAEAPSKPSRTERIQLAIDSLQSYELIKPIPVLIESIGDKVFVAEAPDLNVSITGNSVGASFLLLKDHIVTLYEGYRGKKGTDAERARQLNIFENYIGKTRRGWF
jgi:hypothetical protein